MVTSPVQTVVNIEPQIFWGVVSFAGFVLACLIVVAILSPAGESRITPVQRFKDDLGLKRMNSGLFVIAAALWLVVFALLFFGLLWVIWDVIWHHRPASGDEVWDWRFTLVTLTALTATLGAVVALPITMQRLHLTREQTKTAAEGQITERISKAVDQLGNNNTAVRMGAIHSLERIMVDSVSDRVMVMRTLNAYLKYRQSTLPAEDPNNIPEVEVDMQAALDVILRWNVE